MVEERQFRIVGLTALGRPLVIVFTPRDTAGLAKRVITAWPAGSTSEELQQLFKDCPHLVVEIEKPK